MAPPPSIVGLNCDFKLLEGLEARRIRKVNNCILCHVQYVAGFNRNIHHGISWTSDAIFAVSKSKLGCGIADSDFIAAFDWLLLIWDWKVLKKLCLDEGVIRRLQNLYTVDVVNNTMGRVFKDWRESICTLPFLGPSLQHEAVPLPPRRKVQTDGVL